MCDEGRLTYPQTNEKRVEWAQGGGGPKAVELLQPVVGKPGIGIAVSAQCTNEEAAAAFQLGAHLGAEHYFLAARPPGEDDDFLIRADKNPNTRAVRLAPPPFALPLEHPTATAPPNPPTPFPT